ncbi:MAG TPA: TrkH family potassium uptake protein [Chitinispirillaceae bacterium]|nr:TrkH family potassium uptake protein [Chitinispirillaceae bacterium]
MEKSLIINNTEEYQYWAEPVIKFTNLLLIFFSIAALTSILLQHGFYLSESVSAVLNRIDLIIVQFYLWQFVFKLLSSRSKISFIKRHWFEAALAVLIISEIAMIIRLVGINVISKYFFDINITAVTEIYVGFTQALMVLSIITEGIRYNTKLASLKFHPSQTLMLSFVVVIFAGAALFMLPKVTTGKTPISFIDALFTATSATCVTGLTVVNTVDFSLTGKLIILCLIQIGGLGIMTLSSFLALFFGQGVGIRERVVLHQMMNIDKIGMISTALRNAVIMTLSIEAAGAIMLMFFWADNGWTTGQLIFNSIFHSISAFCNAGFSTFPDSLSSYHNDAGVLLTISTLVILGGLGFIVILDLIGGKVRVKRMQFRSRLSIQTRIVLIITGLLIVLGFVLLYALNSSEAGWQRVLTAFFNSITARTAGFNTVDFATLNSSSILIMMVLMFIGASPGSTGGGIKTTTVGILWASIGAIITGKNRIVIFKRRIPFLVLNRALVVFAFSVMVIVCAAFLLSITEQASIVDIFFETVSAFGTVGLSRGLTPLLTTNGKLIIILLMFIGRLGALTLAFAITAPTELPPVKVEYPSETVMIG